MKFTLRDLFWLILLAAVISMAYRHERLFKRSVELEAVKQNHQFQLDHLQKHKADLATQENKHQADLATQEKLHTQDLRTVQREYYQKLLDDRANSPFRQPEMPRVKTKNGPL